MKYIILICFLTSSKFFSQEKKVIYLNENYKEIDKNEFLKGKSSREYLDLYFENDSIIQSLLVRRKRIGRLNKSQFKGLKENLSINYKIENDLIVLIYYPGKDRCNETDKTSTWNVFDRDYLRKLKKISDINHHWIYKNDENLKYYYKRKKGWKKDKNGLVEKIFFQHHFPCASCVVIDSKGNFIAYFGEFGKQVVWKIAQELKKIE